MKRILVVTSIVLAVGAFAFFAAWARWIHTPAFEPPPLDGQLLSGALRVGDLERTFDAYVPTKKAAAPALVFVLHGSMGDAKQARSSTYHAFDVLADRDGFFVVVYPDGYERHWNGCRAAGSYAANTENIDDIAFFASMVEHFASEQGIDAKRVYATGISNGGHMAYRLALEAPELVAAVAPVAASLPADANLACEKSGRPIAVLVLNGTDDPMNPDAGGEAALYGFFASRGDVLSSDATVAYFAELAGHSEPPQVHAYPDVAPGDGSHAERITWSDGPGPPVVLLRVHGGGHTFPHREHRYPRFIGETNADLDGAEEIWRFFAEQVSR